MIDVTGKPKQEKPKRAEIRVNGFEVSVTERWYGARIDLTPRRKVEKEARDGR